MATDSRIGMRAELHPATDAWMRGDRYGDIVSVSKRARSFLDPRDPRNGHTFRIRMDRSGRTLTVSEGDISRIFPSDRDEDGDFRAGLRSCVDHIYRDPLCIRCDDVNGIEHI